MTILLRLAWRNLWRHKRRTWLTASAIAFSAMLLVFMITIQLGAYDMMIDTTLRVYTGQMQVQHSGYKDKPQMRTVVAEAASLAAQRRERTGYATITVRAQGFALASSAERSYGVPVIGVQPEYERGVSTPPHLGKQGRCLAGSHAQELVIGRGAAGNLNTKSGDERS